MNRDEDMSNTFVSEVGQRSAIFKKDDEIEDLNDTKENIFPEVKIDPPSEMPSVLEEKKEEKTNKVEEIEEDEEFLEAKKKKKSKKYKKRNPFAMFLIIIICLALGAGASYYYFEIYTEKDVKEEKIETKVEEENKIEEIKPTSLFIKELIDLYSETSNGSSNSLLYAKDKVMVADLGAEYIMRVAGNYPRGQKNGMTKEEFKNYVDYAFGKDKVKYTDSDIFYSKCTYYKFVNDYYYYTNNSEACGYTTQYSEKTKIVKAYKENDKLYVNLALAITDGNKIYKNYNATTGQVEEELTDVVYATFDIEKDYTKLNQYKYTFNYDKDLDNYYLVSVELVK